MNEERVREIVRQFPENGLKQVLTSPGNVRDLLELARAEVLPRLDLERMQIDPTTYVTAGYRHVSSDLILTVPLLPAGKGGRRKRLTLTILIELQMQPDRLMLLRELDYLVQIWKQQVREHEQTHKSLASVKLRPVLPVVLHTGSYAWEKMGTLLDLMDNAEAFRAVTPAFEPLFVSLPDLTEAQLEKGGYFGQVLALFKARKSNRAEFAQCLGRTVDRLQELTGEQRQRRLELVSYVEALVVQARASSEHGGLQQRINAALREDEAKLEVEMVRRTMADVYREEGRLADRKQTLLEQLRLRFESLPSEIEHAIEATQDADRLAGWLRGIITAKDLDSIGILEPN